MPLLPDTPPPRTRPCDPLTPCPAFQYCPPSLPPSVLAVLLLRHFTYSIFFPISGLIRSGCPPSPSRCRPLLVLQCADPLTLPRHLSSYSSCLGVPVPTCVRPHFGRPHRLARGRALHDLREVSHSTRMISSPSLLTHSSDPFPPRPFPRLSFCTSPPVSLSPSLLARSPHVRLGAFILILHDTSRLRLPSTVLTSRDLPGTNFIHVKRNTILCNTVGRAHPTIQSLLCLFVLLGGERLIGALK
jgi:hypothetical protein